MNIEHGDKVLEVSIGTGSNIPYYRRYTDALIVGVDLSEAMLKICSEKVIKYGWRNIELIQGCAEYLPIRSDSFERILIGGAISYFSSPKRALQEVEKVAEPGGKIVIYEQITFLDRLLKKDKIPLRLTPEKLKLVNYSYLFGKTSTSSNSLSKALNV